MSLLLASALFFSWGEQEFTIIDEHYPTSLAQKAHAWVPLFLHAHEITLIDPDNSPLLSSHYSVIQTRCERAAHNLPSLLLFLSSYLHGEVFEHSAIDPVLLQWKVPCIPLDAFIASHAGVCRHFVFAAAYFLTRLREETTFPIPEIRILRQTLKTGRHAWLQVGNWHFDPYWRVIVDLDSSQNNEVLYHLYQNN